MVLVGFQQLVIWDRKERIMESKKVSNITIQFNNGTTLKIQEQKYRLVLAVISKKYHELLKKYKIKEPISAGHGN